MKKAEVLKYFDGPTNVARFLKIEPPSVTEWGDLIPEKQAGRIAFLTGGAERNGIRLYMDYQPYLEKDGFTVSDLPF